MGAFICVFMSYESWSDPRPVLAQPTEVSHLLGGYNYGMLVSTLAGGPLADILGGKWLLVVVTLLSGLCTALVPLLASLSLAWLVVSQADRARLSSHWSRYINTVLSLVGSWCCYVSLLMP